MAKVNNRRVAVGNVTLMEKENVYIDERIREDIDRFERKGNSLVLTAIDGELKALIGIRDQVRPGVKEDLRKLKRMGVKT